MTVRGDKTVPYLIKVCLPIPVRGSFDYLSDEPVAAGCRVLVPFGSRKIIASCVGEGEGNNIENPKLKKIIKKIDDEPIITGELLSLSLWMEKRYFTTRGMALKMILPTELKGKARNFKSAEALPFRGELPQTASLPDMPSGAKTVYVSGSRLFLKAFLMREIEKTVSSGGRVIFLVPVMSETAEFEDILGGFRVARFNSSLLPSHRHSILRDFRDGKIDVIIGTRSAVFAPLGKNGLIIMIGAEKKTYIEEQHPRYSTEEVSMQRAELSGGRFIASGGALTVEQFYRVKRGQAAAVHEKEENKSRRVMCDVNEDGVNFGVSPMLLKHIGKTLSEKKQVLLYSPRGGWATSYVCGACKFVMKCEKCSRRLYVSRFNLYCPSCKKSFPLPERCPRCRRKKMKNRGIGRALVASFLRKQFPGNVIRAVEIESDASEKIRDYANYEKGSIDALISGPGFAAIRDWSKTGLFAVMDADFLLYGDDWRAEEKTYLWLASLCGFLAPENANALFLVQTRIAPELVRAALSGDDSFYNKQLDIRRKFAFPPFARILKIKVSGKSAAAACVKIRKDIEGKVLEISSDAPSMPSAGGVEIRVKVPPDDTFEIEPMRGASITIEEER
ncbi:hypothetical protein KJ633_03485 [bacterium]|nr:hypothetical protein [bacterium]MBU3955500.1 hypothetical protein [bacterium]MBU4134067.1 hypothetical protein [bacterium]